MEGFRGRAALLQSFLSFSVTVLGFELQHLLGYNCG